MSEHFRHPVEASGLVVEFGAARALDGVEWRLPAGSAVGLVGRNGSGKTTLLRTALGLVLPTAGACRTLGVAVGELGEEQLGRIGYVDQECELLDWLTVDQHVAYVAAFHAGWDRDLERRLRSELELDPRARVGALSTGQRQRLALLLAVTHRPELLLLDEPVSALDPLVRERVLALLLDRVVREGTTLVLSSHGLHDVEKVVDRVLCLEAGRVVADEELDLLRERHAEWLVEGAPAIDEDFVLEREALGHRTRLVVAAGEAQRAAFEARHGVRVEARPLDLERLFAALVDPRRPAARRAS